MRTALLLINLGTPATPEPAEVRRYLREFLSDPRVIDIPVVPRWLLLNLVILPFRPRRSAAAYAKIWTPEGSPLLVHGLALRDEVQEALGPDVPVLLAMRYQAPSIEAALAQLRTSDVDRIVALPLFPQYSSAAYGSALEKLYAEAGRLWNVPPIDVVPPFYAHPAYIDSFAAVGREVIDRVRPDHVLFSYHGVPVRHCTKSDATGAHCSVVPGCCDRIVAANRSCYRAQCFETTRRLAAALGLEEGMFDVSFQSRLGRTPWIEPYTDVRIRELATSGTKRLVVFSPAFVADCLETLEEIAMVGAASFREAGGEVLELVPSLNSTAQWVAGVVQLFRENAPPFAAPPFAAPAGADASRVEGR